MRFLKMAKVKAGFFLLVFIPLLAACTPAPVGEIPASEYRALEAFYAATGGENWTDQRGWLTDQSPCDWFGVDCEGGHVTELTLTWNNLDGELPAELGDLPKLKHLAFYFNPLLHGTLPTELGKLTELEILVLHNNELEGSIPAEFGGMLSLEKLDLENNNLSGELPPELGNLTQLKILNLRSNYFSGPLPTELGQLTNLEGLLLNNNNFEGPVPQEYDALIKLKMFSVRGNPLIGETPVALLGILETGLDLSFSTTTPNP
jgi:Leucine-rich repeat (LRR) protein